ncbi:hypothetical protein Mgra_00004456 [Meloidogyne graminicola]|uniref:Uncharacterized protein n=1 Tax=Meloidogyne graminicola TaxID=189291 RepID=A0A8S9ZSG0_9BILA|nr:hypothetical protein Mgra_00004456 [Meloidogyne graminicola]
MRGSTNSIKNYILFSTCICFIFIFFAYRSLRSNTDISKTDYYDNTSLEDLSEGLVKLIQLTCSKLDQIAEHNICNYKYLNNEKNCLIFSISTSMDFKFETKIAKLLPNCKIRVYDHEGKANGDSDINYKIIKQLIVNKLDDKWLAKIFATEKRKSKINLLRIEAGEETDKIVQSKLLKEHKICHLLINVAGLTNEKLVNFVKKMEKSYGYNLYSAHKLGEQQMNNEEKIIKNSLEDETSNLLDKEQKIQKRERRGGGSTKIPTIIYTMSFINKNCQKEYGIKLNE